MIETNNIQPPQGMAFIRTMLKGAGQVMFQGNTMTGLFFLLGILWGAIAEGRPSVMIGALVGLITSTLTGYLLNQPANDGKEGLWGFNGILVGCAFPTFLGNTPQMWFALILCAALTTWVRTGFNNVMAPWKTNSFTFPFVFCTWIFLLASRMLQGMPPESLSAPELTQHWDAHVELSLGTILIYWLKGISQVFLINSWVTGILFLVGLYLSNKWAALWASIGSMVSLLTVLYFHGAGNDIVNGLYGFSPVLTAIALGCTFYRPNLRTAIWALLGVLVTVFIQAGMDILMLPFGIPTLTAPFCIATWLFLLPMYKFDEKTPNHSHWHKQQP